MPSISVVITTFNRAWLLNETLGKLLLQRYEPDDEVIVVDNGSTDETAAVLGRAAGRFGDVVSLQHVREAQPGKTPALNAGIRRARGEILALTDDDVIVAPDWIATIRQTFSDPAIALAGGRVDPQWERPAPRWLLAHVSGLYGTMASPLALLHFGDAQDLGARTAIGANLIVRRAVVEAVGGFAPHLGRWRGTLMSGEDHEFCQRVIAAGYRCEYRPEIRVRHWVPASRMRLSYFARWFFWSGLTNAVLQGAAAAGARRAPASAIPAYFVGQLLTASASAAKDAVAGRVEGAAAHAMDAAYALGFITQRVTGRPRPEAAPARWSAPGAGGLAR